jgi:hypothetical protein
MAFNQTDIDNLEAAIARGVRKVKQGEEEVEYRSLSEMKETLRMMRAQFSPVTSPKISATYPRTSRGL